MSAIERAFRQPHQPKEVTLQLDEMMASIVEAALEDVALAISRSVSSNKGAPCQLKLIIDGNQRDAFAQRYDNLQRHYELPDIHLSALDMRDWVSHVQKHFKAIRAGRFYIYGSHIDRALPLSSVPILLDAGAAFGTGEHETTKGCLLVMDGLFRRHHYTKVLDMGCGSGVLAIAAAKALRRPVHAVDNDPVSVRVARANVKRNGVSQCISLQCAQGYRAPLVRGEYDLIIANILARPLMSMAQDLRAHLAPSGMAILSGLLVRQEAMVLEAHRAAGLRLAERLRVGPWSVLVLRG